MKQDKILFQHLAIQVNSEIVENATNRNLTVNQVTKIVSIFFILIVSLVG